MRSLVQGGDTLTESDTTAMNWKHSVQWMNVIYAVLLIVVVVMSMVVVVVLYDVHKLKVAKVINIEVV